MNELHVDESGMLTDPVPLFPLPGTVFFPNVVLPLHVFEERYRSMVADALDGNRLIAVALLREGHEASYDSKAAPVHEVVCVGRITAEERLPDGRYHLVLRGLSRARIVEEPETDAAYRVGRLQLVEDDTTPRDGVDPEVRRAELLWTFRHAVGGGLEEALHRADESIALGTLCDVLGSTLDVPAEARQTLLAIPNVLERSDRLLRLLQGMLQQGRTTAFPPEFSLN